jgi:muramoyltetrapeptide carboxypeptidase
MRRRSSPPTIGVVAPSAPVSPVELELGVDRLRAEGFEVRVHPQVRARHLFFAGTDELRARAFLEMAADPAIDILWCARGGHGSLRLLPLLDRWTRRHGKPRCKLLVGSSDATALLEYTRRRWGWSVLHGPMPGLRKFSRISLDDWDPLMGWVLGWIRREPPEDRIEPTRLRFVGPGPKAPVRGRLSGGNLTLLAALLGTPYAVETRGTILFLEDVDEVLYRVDRLARQLRLAGAFEGVRAIVLGDFINCEDRVVSVLAELRAAAKKNPADEDLKPLRPTLATRPTLHRIFSELSREFRIPLAWGFPAGHGERQAPVPLGEEAVLHPDGRLEIVGSGS